jgi:hypothetical protein
MHTPRQAQRSSLSSREFTDNNNYQKKSLQGFPLLHRKIAENAAQLKNVLRIFRRCVSALTQWSRVLLKKLLVAQKFNKSSPFYGIQTFISQVASSLQILGLKNCVCIFHFFYMCYMPQPISFNAGFEVLTAVIMKNSNYLLRVGFLLYSSTLKKDAICSSVTSVDFQRTTRR